MRTVDKNKDAALYESQLRNEDKAASTINMYVRNFTDFTYRMNGKEYTKQTIILFKTMLISEMAKPATINAHLAAVNHFLHINNMDECKVQMVKIQAEAFRNDQIELTRSDYQKLLETARKHGRKRLFLILLTLSTTGIRVSELKYVTVESLHNGIVWVRNKGKSRQIIVTGEVCSQLKEYCKDNDIESGTIFRTKSGSPIDRNDLAKEMKRLAQYADIPTEKVFPHNFRHLFAVSYYDVDRDLCHLADLLGHSNINTTRIYTRTSKSIQEEKLTQTGLFVAY